MPAPQQVLAKLASKEAKPDGMLALDTAAAVDALLRRTPAARLPGMGGAVAAALSRAGVQCIADLSAWQPQQLHAMLGLQQRLCERLVEWGKGWDDAPVVDKGPPKSLQVQVGIDNAVGRKKCTSSSLHMHPLRWYHCSDEPGILQPMQPRQQRTVCGASTVPSPPSHLLLCCR